MRLIVGLGNPGREYEKTRHNAGFMVVDRLAMRHGLDGAKMRFHAGVLEGIIAGHKCLLMQPVTYMNRSGQAVLEAMQFYKLEPSELLVIVDEVALPLGRIRLRPGGSEGGHNGLLDIANRLGTRDYPRLRVGVDPPPAQVARRDWVLGKFTPDQLADLDPVLDRAADAVEAWLTDDIEQVMSRFNAAE